MEIVTLTIANEINAIPVAQAAAAAYVRAAGGSDDEANRAELVIEEVVAAIIRYEYLPGQPGTISLTMAIAEGAVELLFRFQGIPFDPKHLRNWDKATVEEMVVRDGYGLRLRLIHGFSNELEYRNRGRQGQEIKIRINMPGLGGSMVPETTEKRGKDEPSPAPGRSSVRRMDPEEAEAVSRLAYFAYHYTYYNEYIYDPEEVRRRNKDGRMTSYVAVGEGTGAFLGHLAMIPDDLSGLPELGVGFVNPRYRRSGAFNALTNAMTAQLQQQGIPGTFGTAVTSHPYSQMSVIRLGWKETALFVSRLQAMAFQAIADQDTFRESTMYLVSLFDSTPRRPYYAPSRHREMIAGITGNAQMNVTFADIPGEVPHPERGEIEEKTDANRTAGHIVMRRWGKDSEARLRQRLRDWRLDRLDTIYLYLPLWEPATAASCPICEKMRFFFAGIKPGATGEDWLVLQFLNNQRYDYGRLQAATPFGRKLIDYVRSCDPVTVG